MASTWDLPDQPWVLHTMPMLGGVTNRWIDTQARAGERFQSRLLGADVVPGAQRQPHWLVARDRPFTWVAYRGMWRSRGITGPGVARAFREHSPDIVHAHPGSIAAFERPLARALSAALVTSFYGFDATQARFTQSRAWRRRYRRLFAEAGAVIVEGPKMASRVEALGCPEAKVHVVPLPADEPTLDGCRRTKSPNFVATLAGRFVEKKGFDFGIRAFARGLGDRDDARLMIMGGGPLEDELRRVAAEEGLGDHVIWKGRLPFEAFMDTVGGSDVALYPSRTARNGDSEGGAPVTLIESQWLGVPSIVSTHDDLPFVAAPEGAIVLAPDDIDGWADALRALYADPQRLQAMGESARRHARTRHSPADNLRAREQIYLAV